MLKVNQIKKACSYILWGKYNFMAFTAFNTCRKETQEKQKALTVEYITIFWLYEGFLASKICFRIVFKRTPEKDGEAGTMKEILVLTSVLTVAILPICH